MTDFKANINFPIKLQDYLKLTEQSVEEQSNPQTVAEILHIEPEQAEKFIAEVTRLRNSWAGKSHLAADAAGDLTNLRLMHALRVISIHAWRAFGNIVSRDLPPTYFQSAEPSLSLGTVPREKLENVTWPSSTGNTTLSEVAEIYKALGINNDSLQEYHAPVSDDDIRKARAFLQNSGFRCELVLTAFQEASALTQFESKAMVAVLKTRFPKPLAKKLSDLILKQQP